MGRSGTITKKGGRGCEPSMGEKVKEGMDVGGLRMRTFRERWCYQISTETDKA